jgi:hypothetical protein
MHYSCLQLASDRLSQCLFNIGFSFSLCFFPLVSSLHLFHSTSFDRRVLRVVQRPSRKQSLHRLCWTSIILDALSPDRKSSSEGGNLLQNQVDIWLQSQVPAAATAHCKSLVFAVLFCDHHHYCSSSFGVSGFQTISQE